MAKKQQVSEVDSKRDRFQVTLDLAMEKKIRIIAAALDTTVPAWVNNRLESIVNQEYNEVLKQLGTKE